MGATIELHIVMKVICSILLLASFCQGLSAHLGPVKDVRAKGGIDGEIESLLPGSLPCTVVLGSRAVEAGKEVAGVTVLLPVLGGLLLLLSRILGRAASLSSCRSPA